MVDLDDQSTFNHYLVWFPERHVRLERHETYLVGRKEDCAIMIPSQAVSRHHASVRWRSKGVEIRDLGSTNGTYVNGRQIDRITLQPDDEVRIGGCVITYAVATGPDTARVFARTRQRRQSQKTVALDLEKLSAQPEGFAGKLREVGLPELIQVMQLTRKTGLLRIYEHRSEGRIWLLRGEVVSVDHGNLQGEEAFYELFCQEDGWFEFRPMRVVDREWDVRTRTQALLVAGFKRREKVKAGHDTVPLKPARTPPGADETAGEESPKSEATDKDGEETRTRNRNLQAVPDGPTGDIRSPSVDEEAADEVEAPEADVEAAASAVQTDDEDTPANPQDDLEPAADDAEVSEDDLDSVADDLGLDDDGFGFDDDLSSVMADLDDLGGASKPAGESVAAGNTAELGEEYLDTKSPTPELSEVKAGSGLASLLAGGAADNGKSSPAAYVRALHADVLMPLWSAQEANLEGHRGEDECSDASVRLTVRSPGLDVHEFIVLVERDRIVLRASGMPDEEIKGRPEVVHLTAPLRRRLSAFVSAITADSTQ